jgi:hypothetical protein
MIEKKSKIDLKISIQSSFLLNPHGASKEPGTPNTTPSNKPFKPAKHF